MKTALALARMWAWYASAFVVRPASRRLGWMAMAASMRNLRVVALALASGPRKLADIDAMICEAESEARR